MKRIIITILILLPVIMDCSALNPAPKGRLVYCSYSSTGMAGLGKDWCELIADVDSVPKVVVCLDYGNRFDRPEIRAEYTVDDSVVDKLQKELARMKVHELAGYDVDEQMTGGHAYRIYMEYSSGEKINARWYGHDIKEEAVLAYSFIERYFAPWRERAVTDNLVSRVREMEERFDRLLKAQKKKKPYDGIEEDYRILDDYFQSGQWQMDYEADERGLIPKDVKRGVLSQDALYDVMSTGIPGSSK